MCYFTNWAWYRPFPGKFVPEDTDPNLCTHVVYGFATLDHTELTLKVFDSWADLDNGTCATGSDDRTGVQIDNNDIG